MATTPLNREQSDTAVKLYLEYDANVKDIAKFLHVRDTKVSTALTRRGVVLRNKIRCNAGQLFTLMDDIDRGVAQSESAKHTGISRETVRTYRQLDRIDERHITMARRMLAKDPSSA